MDTDAASDAPSTDVAAEAPLPVTRREILTVGFMLLMFVMAQFLAILLTPTFEAAGIRGFDDPKNWTNGLVLIGVILAFTAIILFIARKKREKLIQWIILVAVGLTIAYVYYSLLFISDFFLHFNPLGGGWGELLLWVAALAIAAVPTWLLYTFPEWYVVDLVGILVSGGAIAVFGTSFTPLTYLVVLAGTAIYDFVSVYKTKHMLDLADSVLELHLPIMLVVPKTRDYSFLEEHGGLRAKEGAPVVGAPALETPAKSARPRDAMFIGLGDIVIPSIFVVSAYKFITASAWPAVGALLGTLAGFVFLMSFVLRGKPQAGLPSLNGGAFVGFLVGFFAAFGRFDFWVTP